MPNPPPRGPSAQSANASDDGGLADRARRLLSGRSAPKAGRALGELGAAALPALREAMLHANPFVRSGALHGLEAAAARSSEDVSADVAYALESDGDPRVRETACGVLARLGRDAVARARAGLERAASDRDERVRAAATSALALLGPATQG